MACFFFSQRNYITTLINTNRISGRVNNTLKIISSGQNGMISPSQLLNQIKDLFTQELSILLILQTLGFVLSFMCAKKNYQIPFFGHPLCQNFTTLIGHDSLQLTRIESRTHLTKMKDPSLLHLKSILTNCNLTGLEFSVPPYTWIGYSLNSEIIYEKLDKVASNIIEEIYTLKQKFKTCKWLDQITHLSF